MNEKPSNGLTLYGLHIPANVLTVAMIVLGIAGIALVAFIHGQTEPGQPVRILDRSLYTKKSTNPESTVDTIPQVSVPSETAKRDQAPTEPNERATKAITQTPNTSGSQSPAVATLGNVEINYGDSKAIAEIRSRLDLQGLTKHEVEKLRKSLDELTRRQTTLNERSDPAHEEARRSLNERRLEDARRDLSGLTQDAETKNSPEEPIRPKDAINNNDAIKVTSPRARTEHPSSATLVGRASMSTIAQSTDYPSIMFSNPRSFKCGDSIPWTSLSDWTGVAGVCGQGLLYTVAGTVPHVREGFVKAWIVVPEDNNKKWSAYNGERHAIVNSRFEVQFCITTKQATRPILIQAHTREGQVSGNECSITLVGL